MKKSNILFFLVLLLMAASGTKAQTFTDVSTFDELQAAVSNGARIRLTSNITFTQQITIDNGVKVVIDGNGKTLTGSSCRAFLVNSSAVLSLKNVTINGFDLNAGGGAFRNYGTLVFDGCTISNNHTDGSSQGGGAIENGSGSKLYASNTVFSNNYSSEIGGAINNYGGCLYLGGCTFTNNYTTSFNARYGGAIGVNGGSEVRIVNCTFSGNKYGTNQGASDLGVYSNAQDYTIAGCPGIVIQSNSSVITHDYGGATPDFSDLDHLEFDYESSDEPLITIYDLTLAEGSNAHGTVTFMVGDNVVSQAEGGDVVTVAVSPVDGYSTKNVTVSAYTAWSAGARQLAPPTLLHEIAVTKNVSNGTWQFTMPEANVWVTVTYAKVLQDEWIQAIADLTYTGEAHEPAVTVQDGSTLLTLNTHYTVAYANNVNAGTATVTVTAVEGSDYSGTAQATFNILKADITAVTPPTLKEVFYTGEAQALIEIGSATGGEMQYSLDGETYATAVPTAVETGNYTIYYKVVGDGNHNDVAPQTMIATILRAENKLLAELYEALGDDVWTGYGTTSGVISYSRGDGPKEFKATFMGGAYTITVPFDDVVSAQKVDNGDDSFTYTLVVNLPAETGMASETLHVTMKNGEITELESENTGISMGKESGEISTWADLQTAIGNGGVIKLSQNITAGSTDEALTVPAEKTVVLDLNGFTLNRALTGAVANGSVIVVNGTLAIMDGVGTGVITGGNTTGNGGGILNNGTVTLYGGEISGNHADGLGGGVYNTATNTDTEGFWMTGGLIHANTANSYPAIGGDVTFNNLAVVQVNADGTTLSAKTAKAGMGSYSYIKPVMPDSEKFGILTELYTALGDDVWTGYGTTTGVISYSQGDELNEFKATFMGGTYTIAVPFGDVVSAAKVDNGDGSFTYTLVVSLPAETGMASETLHVTMKNGEITELESENTGISMDKESGEISTWAELQTAIGNGGVIKLSQDITAESTDEALTVAAEKTVVLDLNGFTLNRALTSAVANGSVIVVNGTLAIMDGVGTGIITGGNTTGNGGGILNNGTVTLYGGKITGNHADGMGGGVYNTATNTDTEGFWMTGGLIDANTADSYPAIGGQVTFNNLAVVQIDADGTTLSAKTAKAGLATLSYIMPVMPDSEKFGILAELYNALGDDVWTGYGTSTGVISYSQGDELNEFKATFMGGTYTIAVPFGDVVSAEKTANEDGSFTYTLVVSLPAETGMASETLHVTMKNGEITELESENTGISMDKESSEISTWAELQTAIGNGGVIKLSQNIVAESGDEALTVPAEKTVVLDLNGFTLNRALTGAVANGSVIVNNGTLAIMDGVGTGVITGGNTTGNGGGILNNGTVTLYGGEITGNHADGLGGGVFNSVMNTDTEGFWMTGGLIDANTADICPAIGGQVTFNDMAFVQIDADGTTFSVTMALDNMAYFSYIKPVMPDNEMYALRLMLGNAIDEAVAYYSSIRDTNPDSAAPLSNAIGTARNMKETYGATQADIENAITALNEAVEAAKADVALKRITISIPAKKSFVARIDADKRQIEHAVSGVSLYTVKSVTDEEVRLTTELSVVAAEMPYLIYNDNDEAVSVNMVVSSNDADEVEYDSEHFKGTLTDKTFTDEDMQEAYYYLLSNGHNFVWVKDAGTLGAGKCWIELPRTSDAHARSLTIVFENGETTGISETWKQNNEKPASVYDLQGRRITQPTRGLYIIKGKKVLVK